MLSRVSTCIDVYLNTRRCFLVAHALLKWRLCKLTDHHLMTAARTALFGLLYSFNILTHSSKSVHVTLGVSQECVKGLGAFWGPLEDLTMLVAVAAADCVICALFAHEKTSLVKEK